MGRDVASDSVLVTAGTRYPFFELLLSPRIGAAARRFGSVSAISNALRPRREKL